MKFNYLSTCCAQDVCAIVQVKDGKKGPSLPLLIFQAVASVK
jgi:hypothetical protein